jgi:hypothetical protein
MFADRPPRPANEEINPYAPPSAAIGEEPIDLIPAGDLAAAEAIRRAHLGHEASVKSIGSLHFLGAIFGFLGVGLAAFEALFGGVLINVMLSGLHLALGIGLTRLQTWARWTDVVLISFSLLMVMVALVASVFLGTYPVLLIYLIAALIPAYMLYLLVGPKASTVFSPEYKAIIARTPHIKYRTSLLVKIVLAIFVTIILLAIVGAIVGGSR